MAKQTSIADVKRNCPVFKASHCPFTGLKAQLAKSSAFEHGCIVKPGQCQTLAEVSDVLSTVVPQDEAGEKVMAHAIQQAILLTYNEERKLGKECPVHPNWPFNTKSDGTPVFTPQTAIDSVYVTMDTIKGKCPAFQKGCPYNVPDMKGLAKGCPAFKEGCPFKDVRTVGELREKLGEMIEKCPGIANYNKALKIAVKVSGEKVAELGHCPFHKYGCQLKEDLQGKPLTNDFVELAYVSKHCPVFQEGKFCPYNMPCLKGLAKGCPEFEGGCPFNKVKTIGEFKELLGEMRDKHGSKAKENHEKALDMIHAATGEQTSKFGHCPFFKFGCPLKTDENDKPIVAEWFTMEYIQKHCPSFKGKGCPFHVPEIKELTIGCPAFKNGCPFKDVRTVGELQSKLGQMRNDHKSFTAKSKQDDAIKIIHSISGKETALLGKCPFFKSGCPFKTDRQGKPIVPDHVTLKYVKQHCPSFEKSCPYKIKEFEGLASSCPAFNNGCPFKNLKTVGDLKAKLGETRDCHSSKGKENLAKAIELIHETNGEAVVKHGHCPFFADGCQFKKDQDGRFIDPENLSMEYIRIHCPAFEKGKACPYNTPELKELGKGCPAFAAGKNPFEGVKNVGEFKVKLAEMRDTGKGNASHKKAIELIRKANEEGIKRLGRCPVGHCEFKTDLEGKPTQ